MFTLDSPAGVSTSSHTSLKCSTNLIYLIAVSLAASLYYIGRNNIRHMISTTEYGYCCNNRMWSGGMISSSANTGTSGGAPMMGGSSQGAMSGMSSPAAGLNDASVNSMASSLLSKIGKRASDSQFKVSLEGTVVMFEFII